MKSFCLMLDLKDDTELIREYEEYHKSVWPQILKSIKDSGIIAMDIYRFNNRLVMIIGVDDTFSFERKQLLDKNNQKVQEWEELMWKFQQSVPGAGKDEKWVVMNKIFNLT